MSPVAATVALAERYRRVRAQTEALCAPLEIEDYVVQPMVDASPPKWHLAHTSWFFETFVLKPFAVGAYREIDPRYAYLFNSYYVQAGERHCRDQRGMVTRPTVRETYAYRAHVDEAVLALLERRAAGGGPGGEPGGGLEARVVLGLHHEQQHQELLLTDLKYAFSRNPLRPAYHGGQPAAGGSGGPVGRHGAAGAAGGRGGHGGWRSYAEGLQWIGFPGPGGEGVSGGGPGDGAGSAGGGGSPGGGGDGASDGFCFDNETPRHRRLVRAFALAERPVTNGEYAEFIADGGYRRPELWLSDGWAAAQAGGWTAPLYWEPGGGLFTLDGVRPLDPEEAVCHVSYYEADAYARWRGLRLPDEAEWEVAARREAVGGNVESDREGSVEGGIAGNFLESGRHHPGPARGGLFGDVWVWTMSPYSPYPGYRPAAGALGEYNGKFMVNQMVLRGGSCATPRSHIRASYRNFFHPDARWQFTGVRLARDE